MVMHVMHVMPMRGTALRLMTIATPRCRADFPLPA
jgi:hypothetical protein